MSKKSQAPDSKIMGA